MLRKMLFVAAIGCALLGCVHPRPVLIDSEVIWPEDSRPAEAGVTLETELAMDLRTLTPEMQQKTVLIELYPTHKLDCSSHLNGNTRVGFCLLFEGPDEKFSTLIWPLPEEAAAKFQKDTPAYEAYYVQTWLTFPRVVVHCTITYSRGAPPEQDSKLAWQRDGLFFQHLPLKELVALEDESQVPLMTQSCQMLPHKASSRNKLP
jgi:hypothetical protein